nr:hypothetical protein [Tanacetum cinerariifolium]
MFIGVKSTKGYCKGSSNTQRGLSKTKPRVFEESKASEDLDKAMNYKTKQNILWTQQGQTVVLYSCSCITAACAHDLRASADALLLANEIMLRSS